MAKMKFDDTALDEVTSEAALQAAPVKESKGLKDIMIKKVSIELFDILKAHGHTFGGYAKVAIQEKMKRDGLI